MVKSIRDWLVAGLIIDPPHKHCNCSTQVCLSFSCACVCVRVRSRAFVCVRPHAVEGPMESLMQEHAGEIAGEWGKCSSGICSSTEPSLVPGAGTTPQRNKASPFSPCSFSLPPKAPLSPLVDPLSHSLPPPGFTFVLLFLISPLCPPHSSSLPPCSSSLPPLSSSLPPLTPTSPQPSQRQILPNTTIIIITASLATINTIRSIHNHFHYFLSPLKQPLP